MASVFGTSSKKSNSITCGNSPNGEGTVISIEEKGPLVEDREAVSFQLTELNGDYANDAEYQALLQNNSWVGLGRNGRFVGLPGDPVAVVGEDEDVAPEGILQAAAPDFYQLEINVAIPNKFTATLVGVSFTGTMDRNGNIYGGVGPSVGKSATGVSGSATANYIFDSMRRTAPSERRVRGFLSGHSFTFGGGFVTGSQGTWVPGNGISAGAGFYTPQIGLSYNYTYELGNPFRAVGLNPTSAPR